MNSAKTVTAKRAWAVAVETIQERTLLYIAAMALAYKSGALSRAEVLEQLLENGITKDDLRRYREWRSGTKVTDFSPI